MSGGYGTDGGRDSLVAICGVFPRPRSRKSRKEVRAPGGPQRAKPTFRRQVVTTKVPSLDHTSIGCQEQLRGWWVVKAGGSTSIGFRSGGRERLVCVRRPAPPCWKEILGAPQFLTGSSRDRFKDRYGTPDVSRREGKQLTNSMQLNHMVEAAICSYQGVYNDADARTYCCC